MQTGVYPQPAHTPRYPLTSQNISWSKLALPHGRPLASPAHSVGAPATTAEATHPCGRAQRAHAPLRPAHTARKPHRRATSGAPWAPRCDPATPHMWLHRQDLAARSCARARARAHTHTHTLRHASAAARLRGRATRPRSRQPQRCATKPVGLRAPRRKRAHAGMAAGAPRAVCAALM